MSIAGPIGTIDLLRRMYDDYKWRIEELAVRKRVPHYIRKELPPHPFETYCKFEIDFPELITLKVQYVEPYLLLLDDTKLPLAQDIKMFLRANAGPTVGIITFKPSLTLFCKESPEPYHKEDVKTPKNITIKFISVKIEAPMFWSRFTQEFIQKEKFFVQILTGSV